MERVLKKPHQEFLKFLAHKIDKAKAQELLRKGSKVTQL